MSRYIIDIDPSRRNLANEIFYDFSCYDALDFEISCIHKVRDFLKELFVTEIRQSKFRDRCYPENAPFSTSYAYYKILSIR
jgi:hypothetical protein